MRNFFLSIFVALAASAILIFLAGAAHAATIGVHAGSWHAEPTFTEGSKGEVPYNNRNPGLYVRSDSGWTAGFYKNSYYEATWYAGWTWQGPSVGPARLEVSGVLATGYQSITGFGALRPMLLPAAVVSLPGGFAARLTGVPVGRGAFGHLSFERSF